MRPIKRMKKSTAQEIIKKTENDYNLIAGQFSSTRKKRLWSDIEQFLPYINKHDKILDVGCGNGRLLQLFSDLEVDYSGIDISNSLIHEAKKEWPKARFAKGDIMKLDSQEASFRAVFCLAVLYHIPSRELRQQAMANLARVVEPGGHVFITVWNLWQDKFKSYIRANNWKKLLGMSKLDLNDFMLPWKNQKGETMTERYCHAFKENEMVALVRQAGLKVIKSGQSGNNEQKYNIFVVAQK